MKEIKQIRVKKTEPNGDFRFMHLDENTWKAIVDSKSDAFGRFELAPADPIKSTPVELIGSGTEHIGSSATASDNAGDGELSYYRELAKEAKIKGYQVMGIETLKKKLNLQ